MPIFGLVWVASWVGCFFSSNQDLLKAPSYPTCVLSVQSTHNTRRPKNEMVALSAQSQPILVSSVSTAYYQKPRVISQTGRSNQASGSTSNKNFSASSQSALLVSSQAVTVVSHRSYVLVPENLFSTLKGLFAKFQASLTAPVAPPKAVKPTQQNRSTSKEPKGLSQFSRTQCAASPLDGALPVEELKEFQVKLKGKVIGVVNDQKQAIDIQQRLEQALKEPQSKADQLQPTIANGVPGVRLGDRLLFSLDKKLVQSVSCNPELLALQWVNNLRSALSEAPLELTEAQAEMYGVRETGETLEGTASWYGPYFHGRLTATGEIFDQNEFTAAHPSLPFDTYLKVTNLLNGKSIIVRVNDRGPYIDDRTLDLSREAARYLGSEADGVVPIEAVIMEPLTDQAPKAIAADLQS